MVDLFNQGKHEEIYQEIYSPEIVSVEADGKEAVGMDGIAKKGEWWEENFETHSANAIGPYPHGDKFIVRFNMDITHKLSGQRSQMDECGLYTTVDGKIVREEFFYVEDN